MAKGIGCFLMSAIRFVMFPVSLPCVLLDQGAHRLQITALGGIVDALRRERWTGNQDRGKGGETHRERADGSTTVPRQLDAATACEARKSRGYAPYTFGRSPGHVAASLAFFWSAMRGAGDGSLRRMPGPVGRPIESSPGVAHIQPREPFGRRSVARVFSDFCALSPPRIRATLPRPVARCDAPLAGRFGSGSGLVSGLVFKTSGGRHKAVPVGSIPMHSRHFLPWSGSKVSIGSLAFPAL